MRGKPVWLFKTNPNWGDDLIDFIMFEFHVMKNTSDTIRVKLSAIKFWHVITGLGDFTKFGGRYLQVLKGMKRQRRVSRKIPFSLDMAEWMYRNFLAPDMANQMRIELYTATVLGFFFLLRIGELEKLRMSDVQLGRGEDLNEIITIHIRNSKTDQFNEGDFKTLSAIPGIACPVKAMARLISSRDWDHQSDKQIFGGWLRNRLCATLRLVGVAIGIPASRIGNHSLRSGGVTAMWRAGYDIETIKRWGRWKSASPQGYLRDGRRIMASIGRGMVLTRGNTYQFAAR